MPGANIEDGVHVRVTPGRANHEVREIKEQVGMTIRTVLLLAVGAQISRAQETVTIRGAPNCVACRIEAERTASIPQGGRPSSTAFPGMIARDRRGMVYVSDYFGSGLIRIYDSTGRAVTSIKPLSSGGGPQLLQSISVDLGDSLHVFGGSHTVFDPSWKQQRTGSVPDGAAVYDALWLPDHRTVLQAASGSPSRFGLPLHVLSSDGLVQKSFGANPSESNSGSPFMRVRAVSRAGPNEVWSGYRNRYEVQRWSIDGRLIETVIREVEWFPAWTQWNSRFDVEPPPPRLMSVWQDRQGRLWTLTQVAAESWKPVEGHRFQAEGSMPTITEIARANDTIIEVLEPSTHRVLASKRFHNLFQQFLGDGLVAEITTDSSDAAVVGIWRVRVSINGGG